MRTKLAASGRRCLRNRSLKRKNVACRSGKNEKQRITAVFFVNAEGEKEGLIVIGSIAASHVCQIHHTPAAPSTSAMRRRG